MKLPFGYEIGFEYDGNLLEVTVWRHGRLVRVYAFGV